MEKRVAGRGSQLTQYSLHIECESKPWSRMMLPTTNNIGEQNTTCDKREERLLENQQLQLERCTTRKSQSLIPQIEYAVRDWLECLATTQALGWMMRRRTSHLYLGPRCHTQYRAPLLPLHHNTTRLQHQDICGHLLYSSAFRLGCHMCQWVSSKGW